MGVRVRIEYELVVFFLFFVFLSTSYFCSFLLFVFIRWYVVNVRVWNLFVIFVVFIYELESVVVVVVVLFCAYLHLKLHMIVFLHTVICSFGSCTFFFFMSLEFVLET